MKNKLIDIEFYVCDGYVYVNTCRKNIMWKNNYLLTEHRTKLFIKLLGKKKFALLFIDNFVP